MDRQSKVETLERRELLAAEVLSTDITPHPIFTQGTPQSVIDAWEAKAHAGENGDDGSGGSAPILSGSRWRQSALGTAPNEGDPIGLTWSIVPDGTDIINPNSGDVEGTSNLVGFLDNIYGGAAEVEIADKPWFVLFERVYDAWGDTTGLTFEYEPVDDGAPMAANASIGVDGVRGDMRVSGRTIDGPSNVLAFNYFPNGSGTSGSDGDMVIDTADTFYANTADGPTGRNTGLHNVLAHEVGHGLGIAHVIPVSGTKLMEPFVNLGFYGPQEDDIYNANQLYGDNFEPSNSIAAPHDLGALRNEAEQIVGASLSSSTDVDVYRFEVAAPTIVTASLQPTGTEYLEGGQFGSPAIALVNRRAEANLGMRILLADGTVIQEIDNVGIGAPEALPQIDLPVAGEYFVEVFGAGDTQIYDLTLRVGRTFGFDPQAGDLRLISVNPNTDGLFDRDGLNVLQTSPGELTFRFSTDSAVDESSLAGGIRISGAGVDQLPGTPDDVVITPGWIGFGENQQTVIARFAEPLADSRYRIEVFGIDINSEGVTALRETDGGLFKPRENGTDRDTLDFELELGGRVLSVVPQPVTRNSSGVLTPQRQTIHLYFNDNDLFANGGTDSLKNPGFYQLISTQDTLENIDDTVRTPSSVTVVEFETQAIPDPANPSATIDVEVRVNRVELTFANDLADYGADGALRLKVGAIDQVTVAGSASDVNRQAVVGEVGDSIVAATALNFAGGSTVIVDSQIIDVGLPFDLPGNGFDEPSQRDIFEAQHLGGAADSIAGIQTWYYNFALNRSYATLPNGTNLFTSINDEQIQRTREVFEFYSELLGIDFIETTVGSNIINGSLNTTVVLGDLAAVGQVSGPGGVLGAAGATLAVMDANDLWYNGFGRSTQAGSAFFDTLLHEIGHSLGLGHAYDLPPSTIMGSATEYGSDPETNYPGQADLIHGRYLHRPDNRDVDMYSFVVPIGTTGTLSAETFAKRSTAGSLLNTHLSLFKQTSDGIVQVSGNDDSFGTDSSLTIELGGGSYFIGVTAHGNHDFDPELNGSGSGGDSEGKYQLRVNFQPQSGNAILDAAGTPIDGDGDGTAGGEFNYFFRADTEADTLYVDASAPAGGDGSAANPFAQIDDAITASTAGQTVRIVGNAGADGQIGLASDGFSRSADNFAYEIGRIDSINQTLDDGRDLIVPKDVNVVIDAGVILKMLGSRISVGSNPGGIDASGGSLQVLGVPHLPVFFTSHNDTTIGLEDSNLGLSPQSGDYGGIDIRNGIDRAEGRFDAEREGLFLNNIFNADIQFGGGLVPINGSLVPIEPIRLDAARPTVIGTEITNSSGAAISADPPSFQESLFTDLLNSNTPDFVPDYQRVGPILYGNDFSENAVNGLLVRIDTLASNRIEQLETSARFDDTEVVHVLSSDLLIRGNPSGNVAQAPATTPTLTTLAAVATPPSAGLGAGLTAETYTYVISFVDKFGFETLPSSPTVAVTAAAGESVSLGGIPEATSEFVSRRLYRANSSGVYGLVAELDRSDISYVDSLMTPGTGPLNPADSLFRTRLDARLKIDAGVTVKASDVRIELGFGADLIAEGDDGRPVIFTSRDDDRYGAGGTFDTQSDGETDGDAGDWAGIYARPFSSISVDHSVIAYAGGTSLVDQTSVRFNALEIRQADARIAHTTFESSASGFQTGSSDPFRASRQRNAPAVIYVSGAQPTIVDNTFIGTVNDGGSPTAAISINVNALEETPVRDLGRQTGPIGLVDHPKNFGPLVRGNELEAVGIAGMQIRPEILATSVVFDDTDIVHVVNGRIIDSTLHTYGGLRLQSRADESLVVKFDTANGTLEADGRSLDIADRIGGTLHVIGQPDFPVVLTSIHDDTVGAGLDPQGLPLTDTNGNQGSSIPGPGDWVGLRLREFSNDRNVDTIVEQEGAIGGDGDLNSIPSRAQNLGRLAIGEKASDENLRLGFTINGTIDTDADSDVYTFQGVAGTTVYFDIDRTVNTLDSILELIDGNGAVLASSDDSHTEAIAGVVNFNGGLEIPMQTSVFAPRNELNGTYRDMYSTNPKDAGMRLQLPGATGAVEEYFIRVRGKTSSYGQYQLQLRLREVDEFAGSTVRYSDIRYATVGIDVEGQPLHSPLVGEGGIAGGGANPPILNVGNLAASDRAAISVSGFLNSQAAVNRYQFTLSRDGLQTGVPLGAGVMPTPQYISATFDLDFADGLARPDTSLLLYRIDPTGATLPTLIMVAGDSNVLADRSNPLEPTSDVDDLSRGSVNEGDAFLGSVELLAGTYEVVVVGNARIPTDFNQQFVAAAGNPNVRLEPNSSIIRIAEDRFGDNTLTNQATASAPVQVVFQGENNAVPFGLGDVTLFAIHTPGTSSNLIGSVDPVTGVVDASYTGASASLADIAVSPQGNVYASSGVPANTPQTDANAAPFYLLNESTQAIGTAGGTGIGTFEGFLNNGNPVVGVSATNGNANNRAGNGIVFNGLAYQVSGANNANLALFGVGGRGNGQATYTSVTVNPTNQITALVPDTPAQNYLYRLNPTTGAAINATTNGNGRTGNARAQGAGTNSVEVGRIDTTGGGLVTGLSDVNQTLFAVTNLGELISVPVGFNTRNPDPSMQNLLGTRVATILDPDTGAAINFQSLTTGPRNIVDPISGLRLSNFLFATDPTGKMFAFDTTGTLQPLLTRGQNRIATQLSAPRGISFSNLDINLFHRSTVLQGGAAGHGAPVTQDLIRDTAVAGQTSLFFGYENPNNNNQTQVGSFAGQEVPARSINNYDFAGGAQGQVESSGFDLSDYASADEPVLYFNYLLNTENQNAAITPAGQTRDSVRVYVASEENQVWTLVATNNSTNVGHNADVPGNNNFDEFDRQESRYVDENGFVRTGDVQAGQAYVTRQLHDVNAWRQARVPLAPWAGHSDVRLRVDFATAGESQNDVSELRAVAAQVLLDGIAGNAPLRTFTITDDDLAAAAPAPVTNTFEFDFGLVVEAKSGAAIANGDQFTLTPSNGASPITYTYVDTTIATATLSTDIPFTPTDSAGTVANSTMAVLSATGFTMTQDNTTSNRFSILAVDQYALQNGAGDSYSLSSSNVALINGTSFQPAPGNVIVEGDTVTATNDVDATTIEFAYRDNALTGADFAQTGTASNVVTSIVGAVNASGFAGSVDAITASGEIFTVTDGVAGPAHLTTSNGSITSPFVAIGDGTQITEGDTLTLTPGNGDPAITIAYEDESVYYGDRSDTDFTQADTAAVIAAGIQATLTTDGFTVTPDPFDATVLVVQDGGGANVDLTSDSGFSINQLLQVSDGATIVSSDSFTLTPTAGQPPVTFTFINTNLAVINSPTQIPYLPGDTLAAVRTSTLTVLGVNGFTTTVNASSDGAFTAIDGTDGGGVRIVTSNPASIAVAGYQFGAGNVIVDGDTLVATPGNGVPFTKYAFNDTAVAVPVQDTTHAGVGFLPTDDANTVATNLSASLTAAGFTVVEDPAAGVFTVNDADGTIVNLTTNQNDILNTVFLIGSGATTADGDTFTLTPANGGPAVTYTFRDLNVAPATQTTEIPFVTSDTTGIVVASVIRVLNTTGFMATPNASAPSAITVVDTATGGGTTITTANPAAIDFSGYVVSSGAIFSSADSIVSRTVTMPLAPLTHTFRNESFAPIVFGQAETDAALTTKTLTAINDPSTMMTAVLDPSAANRISVTDALANLVVLTESNPAATTVYYQSTDGSTYADGDTVTLTPVDGTAPVVINMRDTALNPIAFDQTDSPQMILAASNAAFTAAGLTVVLDSITLPLPASTSPVQFASINPLISSFVNDSPGVGGANVAIQLGINDAPGQVQTAMQTAIATTYTAVGAVTNTLQFPLANQSVRMFGFSINDPGSLGYFQNNTRATPTLAPLFFDSRDRVTGLFVDPATGLGIATPAPGQDAGVYTEPGEMGFNANPQSPFLIAGSRASNNAFGGFHIDDVIIGFAERGEMVLNANPGQALVNNPDHEPLIQAGGTINDRVDVGAFQLEVRLSAEYIVPTSGNASIPVRAFDTNDVIGSGVAFRFTGLTGGDIADGDTVTLSDGVTVVNFEFENVDLTSNGVSSGAIPIPFNSGMEDHELANAFRDAINTPAVQASFGVSALSGDGTAATGIGTSDTIHIQGSVASDLVGNANFTSINGITAIGYGTEFNIGIPFGIDSGDQNRFRDQGQIILESNIVSDSSDAGIAIDAGARNRSGLVPNASTALPRPGTNQAFGTPNPGNLVPGPVVRNNILVDNANAGLRLDGDTISTLNPAPAAFIRVLNNTIVGNGVGVNITNNVAPTLLNNALVGNTLGIFSDGSSGNLEVFKTLYSENGSNTAGTGLGATPVQINGVDVFVDTNSRNFYPGTGSLLIDNGTSSLDDRFGLRTLRSSLGYADSPIFAPVRDLAGVRRTDDGDPSTGGGTGGNVFIDIGALDRSDRLGPTAQLTGPLDNDAEGIDKSPVETLVQLESGVLNQFVIRLDEVDGTGIDDSSVTPDSLVLTQDGRLLRQGVDYTFGYQATNNTIVLTPASGIWTPASAYEITLNNRDRQAIEVQSGDLTDDGNSFSIIDNDGTQVQFEFDGGFVIRFADVVADGDIIRFTSGPTVQFEFDSDGTVDPATTDVITIDPADTAESLSVKFALLLRTGDFGLDTAVALSGNLVSISANPGVDAEVTSTAIEVVSLAGVADGAVAISYLPTADFSAESMAASSIATISRSALNLTAFTPGGGQIFIDNVAAIENAVSAQVDAIVDLAGNDLQANRVNRETQFTILMPGTQLDFGDAIAPFPTLLAANGARHTVIANAPRFGRFVDAELDSPRSIGSTDDAGLTVTGSGSGGLSVTNIDGGIELAVDTTIAAGDTVSINLGGGDVRGFELVLAGNAPTNVSNIAVLLVPINTGESPSALAIRTAERLASVIAANLADVVAPALAPAANVQYQRDSDRLQLVSVDDEDGVLIFDSGVFAGMFIDPDFDSMGGTVAPSEEVLNFLNPNATEGVLLALDVQGSGLVDAWIDFNDDKDFNDVGEQVLFNQPVIDGDSNRVRIVTPSNVSLPGGSKQVWARFRISNTGNQRPDGLTIGGEVEDHRVAIIRAPLPQPISASYSINEDNIGSVLLNTAVNPTEHPPLTIDTSAYTNVQYVTVRETLFGTLDLTDTGEFSYQPNEDFFGTDVFTYQIIGNINIGGTILPVRSELATVTITVDPVNDVPSGVVHVFSGTEGVDLTISGDDLLEGALAQEDADLRTTPFDEKEQSLTVININVFDDAGAMTPIVTPTDIADPFSIVKGTYTAESHILVSPGVFQPYGTVTVVVETDATSGMTQITSVTFAPEISIDTGTVDGAGDPIFKTVRLDNYNRNSPAPVTFEYVIADDAKTTLPNGTDATASVTRETITQTGTIALLEQNDAPELGNDTVVTVEDPAAGSTVIPFASLLANDGLGAKADLDGLNASIDENNGINDIALGMPTLVQGSTPTGSDDFIFTSAGGSVSFDPTDPTQFSYSPPADFYGLDSFVYSVTDMGDNVSLDAAGVEQNSPSMLTSTATVLLDVQPQNDLPSTPDKPTSTQVLIDVFTTAEDPASPMIITANSLTADSRGHANPMYRGNPLFPLSPIPGAPQNESNQTFFVSGVFDKDDVEIAITNVGDAADPDTFESPLGTFRPFFDTTAGDTFGHLLRIEYTPSPNFNSAQEFGAGLVSVPDTFAFTLSDDGKSVDQRPALDINGNPFTPYAVTPSSIKATASITVTPVNDAPVLGGDTFATDEDVPLTMTAADILANDVVGPADESEGTNDGALTLDRSPITTTGGGTVTFLGNGDLLYTPAAEFSGQDTFVYTATDEGVTVDSDGNRIVSPKTSTATVTVNVAAVNDPPTISQPTGVTMLEDETGRVSAISGISAGGDEDQMIRITAVSSDPSPFDALTPVYTSPGDQATIPLPPRANASGITTVTVTATDAGFDGIFDTADDASTSRDFIIRVDPVNDAPTIDSIADSIMVEREAVTPVNLTGITAGPAESQPILVTVTSSNASLVRNEDITVDYTSPNTTGSLTYSVQANRFGTTTFTVTVTDGGLDGNLASPDDNGVTTTEFTATVTNIVEIPMPVDDELSGDEDLLVTFSSNQLTANDIAPDLLDGQQLTLILDADNSGAATQTITTTLGATVTFDSVSGQLTYDPGTATQLQALAPGVFVEDSFPYFVNDGTLTAPLPSATVRLTIEGFNDAPTVVDDFAESPTVPADPLTLDPITIRPLTNDFDVDGTLNLDSLIVTEEPLFGSVSKRLVDDGNGGQVVELAYSAFANFAGSDSFKYTVSDNLGQQSLEATIEIQPTRKPTTGADMGGGLAVDGINIDVLANDVPIVGSLDQSSLTISRDPSNGVATPNADGTISYVPNTGFVGTDSFDYTVADTEGNVSEPVRVVVNSVANGTQNPIRFRDVNDDGDVTAFDALLIINRLDRASSNNVPVNSADRGPNYYDVNGSGDVTAFDALLVINRIGQAAPVFEGEFMLEPTLVAPSTSLPTATLPTPTLLPVADSSLSSIEDNDDVTASIDLSAAQGSQSTKLISTGQNDTDQAAMADDRVDESLVDLLAEDTSSEAGEAILAETATDLAFKWLR